MRSSFKEYDTHRFEVLQFAVDNDIQDLSNAFHAWRGSQGSQGSQAAPATDAEPTAKVGAAKSTNLAVGPEFAPWAAVMESHQQKPDRDVEAAKIFRASQDPNHIRNEKIGMINEASRQYNDRRTRYSQLGRSERTPAHSIDEKWESADLDAMDLFRANQVAE